jgi:hypothetical protein
MPVEAAAPEVEESEALVEEELVSVPDEERVPVAEEQLLSVADAEPVAATDAGGQDYEPGTITVPMRPRRSEAKQEEMQFEAAPRGRFDKTIETMYRGENLDQPTFRRRGLKIRL